MISLPHMVLNYQKGSFQNKAKNLTDSCHALIIMNHENQKTDKTA